MLSFTMTRLTTLNKIMKFRASYLVVLIFTGLITCAYSQVANNSSNSALRDNTIVFPHIGMAINPSVEEGPKSGFIFDVRHLEQPVKRDVSLSQRKAIEENVSAMPVSFRKNLGQWDEKIVYQGSSPGWHANINFLKNGLSFGFSREKEAEKHELDIKEVGPGKEEREYMVWNLNFKDANPNAQITAQGKEESHTNYILALDNVKENVPDYRMITYNEIYKDIDLRYYNNGKDLKYDFILKPGGSLSNIQMDCEGIEKLKINERGELEVKTPWGTVVEELPESYQIINGAKRLVKIQYKIIGKTTFGFVACENYILSEALVIDPVTLAWCTRSGSANVNANGYIHDIAVDAVGNVYGSSDGEPNYLTTPGVYSQVQMPGASYVFKLNSTATALVWGTFVPGGNFGHSAIAVDNSGNVCVVGANSGSLITTAGAFDVTPNGVQDVFMFKLNNSGAVLLYSTYIGSSGTDQAFDVIIDGAGRVCITGTTNGGGFPTTAGAFDLTFNGATDAFFCKINPAGSGIADMMYSTFIGGSGSEDGVCLSLDAVNMAYIGGVTTSNNFPVSVGAYDGSFNGSTDAFVFGLNPAGTGLADRIYSTYYGGTGGDECIGIAANSAGETFITGNTTSANLPVTAGCYDNTYNGTGDIFVAKFNSSGSALLYSTHIGITLVFRSKITLSPGMCDINEVFVSAMITSGTFPVTPCAYMSTPPVSAGGAGGGGFDIVFFKMKTVGAGAADLLYSSYFGGNGQDYNGTYDCAPICANPAGEVFIAYTTHSTNVPTTPGVYIPNNGSASDQPVIFKMKPTLPTLNYTFAIGACNNTVNFTGTASGTCIWQQTWSPNYWLWDFGDGQTSNLQNPTHVYGAPGSYNVKLIVGCPKDSITKTVVINPTVTVSTTFVNSSCGSANGTGTATPAGGTLPYTYSWSNGHTNAIATGLGAGIYTVTVSDANGCMGQKTITINASGTLLAAITPVNGTCTVQGSATSTPSGGTPGYTFSWSNGQTTQTAINLIAGTYTVKVTDAAGCTLTKSVTIAQPAAIVPVITAGKQATCGLNNGSSTVTTSGGTSPYTYNWSNGQTTQTTTGLAAGNYTVTVRDVNGCSSTQKAVVTIIPPSTFSVTVTNGTCGNGGSANAVVSGGTLPYTYSWSGTAQTVNPATGISAGNYTAMVTDGSGCTSTKTFSITDTPNPNVATFTISPGATVCVGAGVNFTNTGTPPGTGVTFNWVISPITPANVSGTTTDFSYTFLSTGSYTVSHTVVSGGCSKNVTSTVTVITCSGGPTATATGSSVCSGACATATSSAAGGTAPYTYSWNTGATTQNINPCPASTTTYTVTIRDSGGNISTSTAVVTVSPSVAVNITPTNILCNGGTGSVTATGTGGTSPYTYTWNGGTTGLVVTGLLPGIYTVTITDNKGCTATNTTGITSPPALTGQFTRGTAACAGCGCKEWIMINAVGGTSPYSYTWPDGYTNRYKNNICPGAYVINVTDKNGCTINVSLSAP